MSHVIVNSPQSAVVDAIDGLLLQRDDLEVLGGRPGVKVVALKGIDRLRVSLISGGGAGHEPAHTGLVSRGLLTAAVSGDIFSSPNVRAIHSAIRHCALGPAVSSSLSSQTFSTPPPPGVLLIIKNYTGDRLAFGLAGERARSEGIPVETVTVADDVALEGSVITGRRGLAGTLFVHKVCGALAASGATLATIAAAGRAIAARVKTLGASLSVCSIPGVPPSDRLSGAIKLEIGLGIHGEPGATRLESIMTSDALAHHILAGIVDAIKADERAATATAAAAATANTTAVVEEEVLLPPVAILLNNLGGLSNLEMGVFTKSIIATAASKFKLNIQRLWVAPLMTSLDMKGLSVSILPLNAFDTFQRASTTTAIGTAGQSGGVELVGGIATLLKALDAETHCPAWPPSRSAGSPSVGISMDDVVCHYPEVAESNAIASPPSSSSSASSSSSSTAAVPSSALLKVIQGAIHTAANAILAKAERLNELDSICGDGDCGTTAALMANAIKETVESLAFLARTITTAAEHAVIHNLEALFTSLSLTIGNVAGGTSGILYALMLQSAANAIKTLPERTASSPPRENTVLDILATAFAAATAALSYYANAKAGARTMYDVFLPVSRHLSAAAAAGVREGSSASSSFPSLLSQLKAAAAEGEAATALMAPMAGRSSYIDPSIVKGHPDPGAVLASTWISAVSEYFVAVGGAVEGSNSSSSSSASSSSSSATETSASVSFSSPSPTSATPISSSDSAPVDVRLPDGVSSLEALVGKPYAEVVDTLKALNPDFEINACHFAKSFGIRHATPKLLRVIYNSDKTVREFKRK